MAKKRKIRVALRKNRQKAPRQRELKSDQFDPEAQQDRLAIDERVSRKGDMTRRRTIVSTGKGTAGPLREVDESACRPGRVLSPRGGGCLVQADDGALFECAVRRMLKNLASAERTVVAAGDRVLFREVAAG